MDRRTFLKLTSAAALAPAISSLLPSEAIATPQNKSKSIMIVAHLDDDVIFFLPWLDQVNQVIVGALPATAGHLNIVSRYSGNYDASWQFGRGITSTSDYKNLWLNPEIRKKMINEDSFDRMFRDLIADPAVTEIVTHNPHGCYGHCQHRLVSKVVRRLAVEYGKDVWCPNMVIRFPVTGWPHSTYEAAQLTGLTQKVKRFSTSEFRDIRQIYLDEPIDPDNPFGFWTWGGPNDFPQGRQPYFLAVSDGIDYTENNAEIQWLKEDLPVFGQ